MKWTIGMPSYNNFTEVYFTVQSLRLHHNLKDCEIVVVDNFGDPLLESFCREKGSGLVRYEKYTDIHGTAAPRNRLFEIAKGEFVVCMDSHVLLRPGFFDVDPIGQNLIHGPILFNTTNRYSLEWKPKWSRNMWGVWAMSLMPYKLFISLNKQEKGKAKKEIDERKLIIKSLPKKPFEIWGMGLGVFCCRRDSWLGFNQRFLGFGGEEGYIHEKFRNAGRKVLCDPSKVWMHFFCNQGRKIPFPCPMIDRVRNYILGFEELKLDTKEIKNHFGSQLFDHAKLMIENENLKERVFNLINKYEPKIETAVEKPEGNPTPEKSKETAVMVPQEIR
jgi:glycosyltransferase involved in cell wall biosynthesis